MGCSHLLPAFKKLYYKQMTTRTVTAKSILKEFNSYENHTRIKKQYNCQQKMFNQIIFYKLCY